MGNYSENILIRGMSFLAERQAAIANNLANVDTTSFKRRIPVAAESEPEFASMLEAELPSISFREQTDFGRGIVRETGNPFDVAVSGEYWMQVQDAGGNTYYTRNGQLQLDESGYLTTRNGLRILDQSGSPIIIGAGGDLPTELAISPGGEIRDALTGETWGPINVVELPDNSKLQPAGSGLFIDPSNQTGTPVADGLQQSFLEGSNVDSMQELVAMITVERSFAATQKALSSAGRLQQNIVNNILR